MQSMSKRLDRLEYLSTEFDTRAAIRDLHRYLSQNIHGRWQLDPLTEEHGVLEPLHDYLPSIVIDGHGTDNRGHQKYFQIHVVDPLQDRFMYSIEMDMQSRSLTHKEDIPEILDFLFPSPQHQ